MFFNHVIFCLAVGTCLRGGTADVLPAVIRFFALRLSCWRFSCRPFCCNDCWFYDSSVRGCRAQLYRTTSDVAFRVLVAQRVDCSEFVCCIVLVLVSFISARSSIRSSLVASFGWVGSYRFRLDAAQRSRIIFACVSNHCLLLTSENAFRLSFWLSCLYCA